MGTTDEHVESSQGSCAGAASGCRRRPLREGDRPVRRLLVLLRQVVRVGLQRRLGQRDGQVPEVRRQVRISAPNRCVHGARYTPD